MGIYIPNMEKPKDCSYCILANKHLNGLCEAKYYCRLEADFEHCPLIEIDDEAIDIAQDIMDGCKELKERVDKGIVRCGECKWYGVDDGMPFCYWWLREIESDVFCSYGERRNDD